MCILLQIRLWVFFHVIPLNCTKPSTNENGLGGSFAISDKRGNFCDFLFALLHTKPLLKWVYSIRNEFAPKGSKFIPYRFDPFSEGDKTSLTEMSPLKVYQKGSKFIPYRVDPFSEGDKTSLTEISPLKVYQFHLKKDMTLTKLRMTSTDS